MKSIGKKFLNISLIATTFALINTSASAEKKYLYQWDEGEGTNQPGWTWSNDVYSSHEGWTMNPDGPLGGGDTCSWGYGPRNFEVGYGDGNLAIIDPENRAPSTTSGGSFKVYEDPAFSSGGTHIASWWLWYDIKPLDERFVTDEDTDRWSFYLKVEGMPEIPKDGSLTAVKGYTFDIGTYLCWGSGSSQGAGCPYEGPGNQHYYHYLTPGPGTWLHVELDRHPTHRRNSFVLGDNPSYIESGEHYLAQMHQFYMETSASQSQETRFWVDDMYFYSTKDTLEPNQNDISIASVWVGYWPERDKWEIGWQDG
ncbi:MAG TPA: hypothetical protein EYH36_09410, partial [Desulfocapsa sulfexigens]|nr:hypothetical protein [Desulfocapsa sulfexigens]